MMETAGAYLLVAAGLLSLFFTGVFAGVTVWKSRGYARRREAALKSLTQLANHLEEVNQEWEQLNKMLLGTLDLPATGEDLLREIYQEFREAEWCGKTLANCITELEARYPQLRETDGQLEAGSLIGAR